ncbi:MFS transporter [Salinisphaera aquimarina]|uniref:MFS transporter n=1 Tax=Salinisphaera aquimarina TaxID=2094031 RepID=A0ABV7EPM4_9GAMM
METDSYTPDPQSIRKVAIASVIGATIEWYDFFLYGIVAGLVFNVQYFPGHDPLVNTMLAYATFAVGFIARPLGGLIFGHFGDKVGRKSMLVITLTMMGIATFLIGLLPNYATIGIWAPILLLILRIVQGLAVGGEWGGAVLMTYESAPRHKRGYYGSLPQIGLAIGLCLGSGVTGLLSLSLTDTAFLAWGWRIAFLLSGFLIFTGLYIRLKVMESPQFEQAKKSGREIKVPFAELLRRHPKNIVLGMGARYIDGVVFNVYAVFAISYLTSQLHLSRTMVLGGVFAAALIMAFTIPYFGALSDRHGRRKVYGVTSIVCGIASFGTFMVFQATANPLWIWLAIILPFGIAYAGVYGPEAALFCELFDTEVRYSGVSFVYQFSGIFASGLTPLIATALLDLGGGNPWLIATYTLVVAVISAISVYMMKEVVMERGS